MSKNQFKAGGNDSLQSSRISSSPARQLRSSKQSVDVTKKSTHPKRSPQADQTDYGRTRRKSSSAIMKEPRLKSSKQSSTRNTIYTTGEETNDDNGSVDQKKISKQKYQMKEIKPKKKSIFTQCFQEADDDDVLKQEFLAAEKKKPTSEAKEMLTDDSDKDDVPKRKEFIKKKTSNESKSSLEEDKDRGRHVKTHNTIKKTSRSKQPILGNPKVKDESSSDGSTGQASKCLKGASPISVGIFDPKAPKISFNIRNTKLDKNQDDTVPGEEECDVQTTTNSSPSNTPKLFINQTYFAPTMLYSELQQSATPVFYPSLDNLVPLCDENITNDHEGHYSEIRNEIKPSDINHPVGSIMNSIELLSDHVNVPHILTKKNHPKLVDEKERIKRRKRARTRWYLAYTLIHNRSLIKLRKEKNPTDPLEQTFQRQSQAITHGMQSETLRSHKTK
jgi:hypothetical protein